MAGGSGGAKAGGGASPSAAVAAAALASLLRARPDAAAHVPPSAFTALVSRISMPSSPPPKTGRGGGESGGGGAGAERMLLGELDLVAALRGCGLDPGKDLRAGPSGFPRLVGMLDAPPPGAPTAAAKAALQIDHIIREQQADASAAGGYAAAAYGGLCASATSSATGGATAAVTAGRSACAVACLRCPAKVALRLLGGVDRLALLLAGPEGRPATTMRQAGPPRTLAAVAGCLESAVSGERACQEDAARRNVLPSLLKLITLARAELKRVALKGAGPLETEPELLPNLLLATSAIVRGAPLLADALRAAGGVETLISVLDLRPGGGVTEEHLLAIEALSAAGEKHPEKSARLLELARPAKGSGASAASGFSAAEAAITVRAARAVAKFARPLIVEQEGS